MWHVSIFGYDLETLDCLCVTYDVVEENWSVFLYPTRRVSLKKALQMRTLPTMVIRNWQPYLDWLLNRAGWRLLTILLSMTLYGCGFQWSWTGVGIGDAFRNRKTRVGECQFTYLGQGI